MRTISTTSIEPPNYRTRIMESKWYFQKRVQSSVVVQIRIRMPALHCVLSFMWLCLVQCVLQQLFTDLKM